ncbi:MAG: ABC transporter ATP-binding protein [Halanaerobiales bacterium]
MYDIELKNINKAYADEKIINNLDLRINSGELIALLGPSGCGKTTILKILAGILEADSGDIYFDKQSVTDIPAEKRKAVMVFQDYLLFPHLNVEENIAFGLKMRGVSKKERQEKVRALLDLVGMSGYQNYYTRELSGGQRQRVALARALAVDPEVLLLDEPLSNLDTNLRVEMRELIRKLHREKNMTTIFVTHDREEAMLIADKVALLRKGEVEQYGTPEELYRYPVSKYTADFFGEANYINGIIKDNSFFYEDYTDKSKKALLLISSFPDLLKRKLDGIKTEKVQLMVRPEYVKICDCNSEKNDRNYFEAEIIDRRFAGERVFYRIKIDGLLLKVITLPQYSFDINQCIQVAIEEENIWVLED